MVEITRACLAPIAGEGLKRIGEFDRIDAGIRGRDPATRLAARRERPVPVVSDLEAWVTHHRARVAGKSPLGEALKYIAKYWDGLSGFPTDGRVELDINPIKRTIRPAPYGKC